MDILTALKREEAMLLIHLDTIRKVTKRVIREQESSGRKTGRTAAEK
jgi:hypothetical protein